MATRTSTRSRSAGRAKAPAISLSGSYPAPPKKKLPDLLTKSKLGDIVKQHGGVTKDVPGKPYITLSARTPWVEGKGNLITMNASYTLPATPEVKFGGLSAAGPETRHVFAWLTDLSPGAAYVLQVRVGAWGIDPIEEPRFVLGGDMASMQEVPAEQGDQTIGAYVPEAEEKLGFVMLWTKGVDLWSFYDLSVSKVS
jgi:hypothetical protein